MSWKSIRMAQAPAAVTIVKQTDPTTGVVTQQTTIPQPAKGTGAAPGFTVTKAPKAPKPAGGAATGISSGQSQI